MADGSEHEFRGQGLEMAWRTAPWDRESLGGESVLLTRVTLHRNGGGEHGFAVFRDWCAGRGVRLVAARLGHGQLLEAGLLESQGFRFIELNYRPVKHGLAGFPTAAGFTVRRALTSEAAAVVAAAGQIFEAGRFHLDPRIGKVIGDRRYALWADRAFDDPSQQVLACDADGRLAAFMVVQVPSPTLRFWSLVGLMPGLAGQGLGRRCWEAMLAHHASEGVEEVATSISSHNTAAHNLYVALGFRFPPPEMLFHWCPVGAPPGFVA